MNTVQRITPTKFYWGIGLNRRRTEYKERSVLIAANVDTANELMEKLSIGFHNFLANEGYTRHEWGKAQAEFDKNYCKAFGLFDGKDMVGGFVILGGVLMGLHSLLPGQGDNLVGIAVSEGANALACHDEPHLVKLYERWGFETKLRDANNVDPNGPDVLFMTMKPGAPV